MLTIMTLNRMLTIMTLNRMLTIMTLKKEDEEQHLQIVHMMIQFVNMHCRHMIYKGMNDGNISGSHGG